MVEHKIGDRVYVQDKPVLGQVKQLAALFKKLQIPVGSSYSDLAGLLGENITEFMAIILTQKGTKLRDKDIKEEEQFLDENVDIEMAMEIIESFFTVVPLNSIAERITLIAQKMTTTTSTS